MADKFVIVVDRAGAVRLKAVHEVVKGNAKGWWHHYENTWIVTTDKTLGEWRDLVRSAIEPVGISGVLVLRVAEESPRWAMGGFRSDSRSGWFRKIFT
jgi:hypothetical protein